MTTNKYNFQAFVSSSLYVAGLTEDGEEFIAERFFVAAEFDNGMRFAHNHDFDGCKVETHDEGKAFIDIREEAEAAANALRDRVNAAGKMHGEYWHEMEPGYGSPAYERAIAMQTPRQRAGEEELT